MVRWRNYFSKILSIHGLNDVRQTEIHTLETLVSEPSASEGELAIEKQKSHKSPGVDQIPEELIKTGGGGVEQFKMRSKVLLFLFGMRKNCLRSRS